MSSSESRYLRTASEVAKEIGQGITPQFISYLVRSSFVNPTDGETLGDARSRLLFSVGLLEEIRFFWQMRLRGIKPKDAYSYSFHGRQTAYVSFHVPNQQLRNFRNMLMNLEIVSCYWHMAAELDLLVELQAWDFEELVRFKLTMLQEFPDVTTWNEVDPLLANAPNRMDAQNSDSILASILIRAEDGPNDIPQIRTLLDGVMTYFPECSSHIVATTGRWDAILFVQLDSFQTLVDLVRNSLEKIPMIRGLAPFLGLARNSWYRRPGIIPARSGIMNEPGGEPFVSTGPAGKINDDEINALVFFKSPVGYYQTKVVEQIEVATRLKARMLWGEYDAVIHAHATSARELERIVLNRIGGVHEAIQTHSVLVTPLPDQPPFEHQAPEDIIAYSMIYASLPADELVNRIGLSPNDGVVYPTLGTNKALAVIKRPYKDGVSIQEHLAHLVLGIVETSPIDHVTTHVCVT